MTTHRTYSLGLVLPLALMFELVLGSAGCAADEANTLQRQTLDGTSESEVTEAPAASRTPSGDDGTLPVAESSDPAAAEVADIDPDGNPLTEGDMIEPEGRPSISGSLSDSSTWPGGVVVYVVDAKLSATLNQRVTAAMNHWRANTPITFKKRTTEKAYVTFLPVASGCSATRGYQGAPQKVNLGPDCETGSVVHELGHTLGLRHEQTRSDRDKFIKIIDANIKDGKDSQFEITQFKSIGSYDIGSIMQYSSFAFSKNGKPTITRLDGSTFTSNRKALSASDIAGIKALYAGKIASDK